MYHLDYYRPPLRQYLMDGDFFVGAALATTLTKLALRYVSLTENERSQNVSCFSFHFMFYII